MKNFRNVSPPLPQENIDAFNNWVRLIVDERSCLNCLHGVRLGERFQSMFWDFNEPSLNEIKCEEGVNRFQNGQEICNTQGDLKYSAKAKFCDKYEKRVSP